MKDVLVDIYGATTCVCCPLSCPAARRTTVVQHDVYVACTYDVSNVNDHDGRASA
jgi:hypothetical protein